MVRNSVSQISVQSGSFTFPSKSVPWNRLYSPFKYNDGVEKVLKIQNNLNLKVQWKRMCLKLKRSCCRKISRALLCRQRKKAKKFFVLALKRLQRRNAYGTSSIITVDSDLFRSYFWNIVFTKGLPISVWMKHLIAEGSHGDVVSLGWLIAPRIWA